MQEDDFEKDNMVSDHRMLLSPEDREKARFFEVNIAKEEKRIF